LAHLGGHRLPHLVGQDERSLIGDAKIAGHREHGLALHLVGEDRNRHEVRPQRHLAGMKQRAARHREAMQAGLAAPAGRAVRPAAVIDDGTAAFRAEGVAAVARPPDLAEHRLDFLIRHASDRR
jgi:hypothetical protein